MEKIDRLLLRVKPKLKPWQRLETDNPYMDRNSGELLDMMSLDSQNQAPEMRTTEWNKFIYALVHAAGIGGLGEQESEA